MDDATDVAAIEAVVARLTDEVGSCELTSLSGGGRCIEPAVAARWDGEFIDMVCETHAERSLRYACTILRRRNPGDSEPGINDREVLADTVLADTVYRLGYRLREARDGSPR